MAGKLPRSRLSWQLIRLNKLESGHTEKSLSASVGNSGVRLFLSAEISVKTAFYEALRNLPP